MKTLIIHHLEPMWESGYRTQGTTFEKLLEKFYSHLKENKYDRVILTRFEDWKLDDSYLVYLDDECFHLQDFVTQVFSYDYGWDKDSIFDGELPDLNPDGFYESSYSGELFCNGGQHSEIVWIPEWIFNLSGDVFISGAFDGECIEDLEIALTAAGKTFHRVEELIL